MKSLQTPLVGPALRRSEPSNVSRTNRWLRDCRRESAAGSPPSFLPQREPLLPAHGSLTVRSRGVGLTFHVQEPSPVPPSPHHQPLTVLQEGEEPCHVLSSSPGTIIHIMVYGPGMSCIQEPGLHGGHCPPAYPLAQWPSGCVYVCIWLVLRRQSTHTNTSPPIELRLCVGLYTRCSSCIISLTPHLQMRKQTQRG